MSIASAEIVPGCVPIVRQFDRRLFRFRPVTDERQRESAVRVVLPAQHMHTEHVGVELERSLEIADPEHGVEYAHWWFA